MGNEIQEKTCYFRFIVLHVVHRVLICFCWDDQSAKANGFSVKQGVWRNNCAQLCQRRGRVMNSNAVQDVLH